jgi:uncharacterized phage protein (TIGR01671 family)
MAMQREIKFRAWDKRTRKMVATGFHLMGETMAYDLLYQYGMEHKRKNEAGLLRLNSFVIMEWIGLKEKNGKEIYESDICLLGDGVLVVEFSTTRACFMLINRDKLHQSAYDCSFFTEPLLEELEVIGNIYQNPELLEAHK